MKRPSLIVGLQILFAILFAMPVKGADVVSLGTLLDEMVDRDRLARFPQPAYTCRQASSYDRDATSPAKKETWFANMDWSQFIRIEENDGRKEYVMLDADGPGAVVRFWATWHGPGGKEFSNGTLRVYLDGKQKPAIEGPIADILDGGALTGPPLSEGVSPQTSYRYRGHNLYLPVPYAKHCKITYETSVPIGRGARNGEALYYQIDYRTYDKGTVVKPFSMAQLNEYRKAIAVTQRRLWLPDSSHDSRAVTFAGKLAAGGSHAVSIEGPAAIGALTINLDAKDLDQAFRSTVLELSFDGERSVWCPVGDFFGLGYKFEPYKTWYTEVAANGAMTCYWVMPFQKACRLTLHNLGEIPVDVRQGEAKYDKWNWDDRSLHFHATWRQLTDVRTQTNQGATQGAFDVNYVTVHGRGVYVGDTLTIFNGHPSWWGEGDEKIFVDGEDFPSHFGTGSEDYYGYAWSNPNTFASPFHAQPYGHGANKIDMAVNSRYRSLDAIPFTKSIEFNMELWHSHATTVNYAPTTFFYAAPGAKVSVEPDPKTAKLPVKRATEGFHVAGAIEGETMKVVAKSGGEAEVQDVADYHWSRDSQLWWLDAKIGDTLTLEFNVPKAGRYKVIANLTKAPDYGIVQLSINDRKSDQTIDRYFTSVAYDPIDLGSFELKKGANRLTVEIVGSNEKAIKRQMFGLDYLKLEAVGNR
jgi:D-arabinan exo alpha-(1,3)/(1,5)-arabinofuranosidase (non-reducing end)